MLRRDLFTLPLTSLAAAAPGSRIRRVELVRYRTGNSTGDHLEIDAGDGRIGVFGTLGWGLPKLLAADLPKSANTWWAKMPSIAASSSTASGTPSTPASS